MMSANEDERIGLMHELDILRPLLFVGNARKQTKGSKEYVVTEAVILREGILNGSHGPLFYPLDEVTANIGMWNGIPVTAAHPMKTMPDGQRVSVSARSPDIAAEFQIGTTYNDRIENGERRVDVWLDVTTCNKLDGRIIPAVMRGDPTNVSTGIYSERRPAQTTNRWNGQSYTHSVHSIRADHLAVLMDEDGACSIRDGCGINVNEKSTNNALNPLTSLLVIPMDKTEKIDWLVTNCSCWKGEGSRVTLNTLDETTLDSLRLNAEKASRLDLTVNALKEIGTTVKAPKDITLAELPAFVKNATSGQGKTAVQTEGKSSGAKQVTMGKKKLPKDDNEGEYDDDSDEEEDRDKSNGKEKMTKNAKAGMPDSATKGTDRENGNNQLGNEDDGHQRGTETDADQPMGKEEDRTGAMKGKVKMSAMTKNAIQEFFNNMKDEEFIALAPPGVRQTLNSANEVVEKERIEIINKLTINIKNPTERKAKLLKLKDKSLADLREFMEITTLNSASAKDTMTQSFRKNETAEEFLNNFFGSGTNGSDTNEDQTQNRQSGSPLLPCLNAFGDYSE